MWYNFSENNVLRSGSNEESSYIFGDGIWCECNGTFRTSVFVRRKKCVIRGFKIDGNVLDESEASTIREIINDLNKYGKSGTIDIIGHTDSTGSRKHNLKLSETRAKNFAKLMRKYGLDKRFSFGKIKGEGANSPVDTDERAEGRYNNRRVEIFLNNVEFENQQSK